MPGVKYILTYKNAPKLQAANVARGRILPEPLPRELNLQGEVVAIVVAETEDLAQDAADAIKVTYEVLPFASTAEGQHGCRCARSGTWKRKSHPSFVFARGSSARNLGG